MLFECREAVCFHGQTPQDSKPICWATTELNVSLLSTAVDCGTLTTPANGQVSYSGRTTFGHTATYSCHTGYNLRGGSTRTCQATKLWSGSEPTCSRMALLHVRLSSDGTCTWCVPLFQQLWTVVLWPTQPMAKLVTLLDQHSDRQPPTVVIQATTWWEAVLAYVKLQECGLGVHLPVNVCLLIQTVKLELTQLK